MGILALRCVVFVVSWLVVGGIAWVGASYHLLSTNWDMAKPVASIVGIAVGWVTADFVCQRCRPVDARSPWGASKAAWATGASVLLLSAITLPAELDSMMRHRVREMILATTHARDQISARIRSESRVTGSGVGIRPPAHPYIAEALIEANGKILLRGDTRGLGANVSIRITPAFDESKGELVWKCIGEPPEYFLGSCR